MSSTHSWDGPVYNVQNGMGGRGTACFRLGKNGLPIQCTAACFTPHSERKLSVGGTPPDPLMCFQQAPQDQLELAHECFDYLLEDFDGRVEPLVTGGFWSADGSLVSQDSWVELLQHGGNLFEAELSTESMAIDHCKQRFALSLDEIDMALDLHRKKIADPLSWVTLTPDQLAVIECNQKGIDESWESFAEINIRFSTR